MTFGPSATSVGNPVSYSAGGVSVFPPGTLLTPSGSAPADFVVAFSGQFEDAVIAQEPGSVDPLERQEQDKDGIVVEGEICVR